MSIRLREVFRKNLSEYSPDLSVEAAEQYMLKHFLGHYWFLDTDFVLHAYIRYDTELPDLTQPNKKLSLTGVSHLPIEYIADSNIDNELNVNSESEEWYFAEIKEGVCGIFTLAAQHTKPFLTELISFNCEHLFKNSGIDSDPMGAVELTVSTAYPGRYWYVDAKYQCHIFTPRYDSHKRNRSPKPIQLIPTEVYDSRVRRALNRFISLKNNEWVWINGNNVFIFQERQRLASFVDPKSVDVFGIKYNAPESSDCPAVEKVKNALDIKTVVSAFFNLKKIAEMARPKDENCEESLSDAYHEFFKAIDGIERGFKALNLSDKLVE